MNEIITQSSLLPVKAKVELSFRVATLDDIPFMDALQKARTDALGHWPTKQFEGYIKMGGVLVAEARDQRSEVRDQQDPRARLTADLRPLTSPVGYVISRDRYLKRDELGVIYQLCVVPGEYRKLVGASLIKEVFARSAYGCRLYCCWCAQDLSANYFWESLGFVPIAFRAGSDKKKRVHIFWQKRIVEGDQTRYWYPFQTNGGAIRADRIVFPIPPGVHWKDVQAVVLPEAEVEVSDQKSEVREERGQKSEIRGQKESRARLSSDLGSLTPGPKMPANIGGGLHFAPIKPVSAKAKPPRQPKPKVKNDPRYAAAARELRDRWTEEVQSGRLVIESNGKYDVARLVEPSSGLHIMPALPAA